jgi:hypothetical protein
VDIPYAGRSLFLDACAAAIREQRAELDAGCSVTVDLNRGGGYSGRVIVNIRTADGTTFATDWERPDPTRFPARLKAAATALLHCGCMGRFELLHKDGTLTIQAKPSTL